LLALLFLLFDQLPPLFPCFELLIE
jgi:hypothetical protein